MATLGAVFVFMDGVEIYFGSNEFLRSGKHLSKGEIGRFKRFWATGVWLIIRVRGISKCLRV